MPAPAVSSRGGEDPASRRADVFEAAVDELRVELLRRGGSCTGRLSSGSMAPTIEAGDEVVVEPVAAARRGMVILFRREGRLTVHRIVGRRAGEWIEMGDRNVDAGRVAESELLGRVVLVRKPNGTLRLTGVRARLAGLAIAGLRRLEAGLVERQPGGSGLALRAVRRAADVLIRGAARPAERA